MVMDEMLKQKVGGRCILSAMAVLHRIPLFGGALVSFLSSHLPHTHFNLMTWFITSSHHLIGTSSHSSHLIHFWLILHLIHHLISPQTPPHHITTAHISSHQHHRSTPHHITSHHITSHHITPHHITSHHITSHHITSHHLLVQGTNKRVQTEF